MGHNSILGLTLLMLVASPASCYHARLTHLSTVYVPYNFSGNTPQYEFDAGAVIKAAFDVTEKIIYAVGALLLLLLLLLPLSPLLLLLLLPLSPSLFVCCCL